MRLNLFFPQWQDTGETTGVYDGATTIREWLGDDWKWNDVPVPSHEELGQEHGIVGHKSISRQLREARNIIKAQDPNRIFTIGGGCGSEVAPVSYLNEKFGGDLGVLWFDAHGDLNTPDSSPSHRFHGMPLRALLGDGEDQIVHGAFSHITPEQIVLCGVRSLDDPEITFIEEKSIRQISVSDLANGSALSNIISDKKWQHLYVHLDLDVLDPKSFPYVQCPEEGGVTVENLLANLDTISKASQVVGCSIVEFVPSGTQGKDDVLRICRLLSSVVQ